MFKSIKKNFQRGCNWLVEKATNLKNRITRTQALAGTSLLILPAAASAAVPAEVTTAITEAVTDVGTIGAAILGIIVVIASFAWLRRPIK